MVSSVNAKFMAVEKEKKRQTRLAEEKAREQKITPPEVVIETIIQQNPLEILEIIENVEPKEKQVSKKSKPKKTGKAKKQSKNDKKVFTDI